MTSAIEQVIVAIVAFVGGEASLKRVKRILAAANVTVDAGEEAAKLIARRWLMEPEPGWVALPTRSHREAILGAFQDESLKKLVHRAIGRVLAHEERGLGLAEAAHHLARGGEARAAAQMAMTAARAALGIELSQEASQLLAFAREQDPSVDEELAQGPPLSTRPVLELVDHADVELDPAALTPAPPRPSAPPFHDSEPPTVIQQQGADGDSERPSITLTTVAPAVDPDETAPHEQVPVAAPSQPGRDSTMQPPKTTSDPPVAAEPHHDAPHALGAADAGANVDERLTELAKEALLGADTRALERLRASGGRGRFAERMAAIVRLSRGDVGEALRVLRAARAELDASASAAQRCQASLALGFALAVAHRTDDALLEALDALSRARESGDEKGAHACLAFLTKLYASVDRADDAARLRKFAKIAEEPTPLAEVPI
jgi:hypothetical protein